MSNLTWSFEQFRSFAAKQGKDVAQVFDAMHAVVADTLLVAEPAFLQKWAQQAREQSGPAGANAGEGRWHHRRPL